MTRPELEESKLREVVADALPELPEPFAFLSANPQQGFTYEANSTYFQSLLESARNGKPRWPKPERATLLYTADQMREYARAAIAATQPGASAGVEERAREILYAETAKAYAEPFGGPITQHDIAVRAIAAALRTQPKTGGDVGRDMLRECYEWFFESKADGPRVSEGAIERGYYTPEFRDLYARLRAVIDATPQQEARAVDDGMARDAARYRWLRDNATIEWENEHGVGWHWKPNKPLYVPLDERVDAALTEPAP